MATAKFKRAVDLADIRNMETSIPYPDVMHGAVVAAMRACEEMASYVIQYTDTAYEDLNDVLTVADLSDPDMEDRYYHTYYMHQAMMKLSRCAKGPLTLWRGLTCAHDDVVDDWVARAWTSASLSAACAADCQTGEHICMEPDEVDPGGGTLLRLNVERGVRLLATCHVLEADGSESGRVKNEQEVTIAPGARFIVTDRKPNMLTVSVRRAA